MMDGKLHWRTRDLTGQRFGALVTQSVSHSTGKKLHWVFLCNCGATTTKCGTDVTQEAKRGGTPNCGCLTSSLISAGNSAHGLSKTDIYAVWSSMIARCHRPSHKAYPRYGGRGITVCDSWRDSFEAFFVDMGPTYMKGLTLERTDNDQGYSLTNCVWATKAAQGRNRRGVIREVNIPELSRTTGISRSTLYYRYAKGLPLIGSTTSSTARRSRCPPPRSRASKRDFPDELHL